MSKFQSPSLMLSNFLSLKACSWRTIWTRRKQAELERNRMGHCMQKKRIEGTNLKGTTSRK